MLQFLNAAAASASAAGGPPGWTSLVLPIGLIAIFWFVLIRPQMKRQKEHQAKIASVKKGDQVVTGGGLVGKVIKVDDHYAEVELAPGMKVKAVKSTLTDIVPPGGTAAND